MSEPETAADKRLHQQVCAVHAAMAKQLELLWDDDKALIDGVEREAAFIGTMTALLHKLFFLRVLMQAITNTELTAEEDLASFLRFASDCWDDWNGREYDDALDEQVAR